MASIVFVNAPSEAASVDLIWFGSLLLETYAFWIGASLAAVSAACAFASLEESGAPWERLPVDSVFLADRVQALLKRTEPSEAGTSGDD